MKKLLVMIVFMLVLCGCSKEEEIDMKNEAIKYIDVYYHVDKDLDLSYGVTMDFTDDNICLIYREYDENETTSYEIYDAEKIITFIKEKVSKENNILNEERENSSEKLDLWSIRVRTEQKIYSFSDYEEYPTYWKELWEMLVETTEAEDISAFGFINE